MTQDQKKWLESDLFHLHHLVVFYSNQSDLKPQQRPLRIFKERAQVVKEDLEYYLSDHAFENGVRDEEVKP